MMMNLKDYRGLSRLTVPDLEPDDAKLNCALGLAGEVGELLDIFKKKIFHGHYKTPREIGEVLVDELGDFAWYFAWLVDLTDVDVDFCTCVEPIRASKQPAVQLALLLASRVVQLAHKMAGGGTVYDEEICEIWHIWIVLVHACGFDNSEIFAYNVAKLVKRYPEGFSEEASRNRFKVSYGAPDYANAEIDVHAEERDGDLVADISVPIVRTTVSFETKKSDV